MQIHYDVACDPDRIVLTRPDDWHFHARDGEGTHAIIPHVANTFARAIMMPNLKPPVITTAQALAYRDRIRAAIPEGVDFQPLMTLFLTDSLSPDEIGRASYAGVVALKLYPAGATTHSDAGVTDIRMVYPTLEAMQRHRMPLLVHGEVVDPNVDIFDREPVFIERELIPLRRDFPELKIVVEHITTREAAHYVRDADRFVAATITVHHLLYNRNAIFRGGVRTHYYCLPVLKRESHRLALVEAATSGSAKFFLGTDNAAHSAHLKEHACGCAGCYSAHPLEHCAAVFDSAGKLGMLEGFTSIHGAQFYGLPLNQGTISVVRRPTKVPASYPFGEGFSLKPYDAGETLEWSVE